MTRSLDRKPVPVFIAIRLSVGSGAPFFSHVTSSSGESGESTRHLIVTSRPGTKSYDGWENVITGGKFCSVINKRMKMLLKQTSEILVYLVFSKIKTDKFIFFEKLTCFSNLFSFFTVFMTGYMYKLYEKYIIIKLIIITKTFEKLQHNISFRTNHVVEEKINKHLWSGE